MSDIGSFAVGDRVRVYTGGSEERTGTIAEDFGDLAGYAVTIGAHLIVDPSRRWAIEIDGGGLVFANSTDVRPLP